MHVDTAIQPILIELDERTWNEQWDRVARWFGNVQMAQAAFRQYAEDTLNKVNEPNIQTALTMIVEKARDHEGKIQELYSRIEREPSQIREAAGVMMAKANEAIADIQGLFGGAVGSWKDIHRLLLANLNALGAFAVCEQLGLALGLPEMIEITFPIIHEKETHQLILNEFMLETAPISILYQMSV